MKTDNRHRPRRRILSLAAVLGLLLSLLVTGPAAAAETDVQCGNWQTVRTSIRYQACTSKVNGTPQAKIVFQNNHGASVHVYWQQGYRLRNSTTIDWEGTIPGKTIAAGRSSTVVHSPAIWCVTSSLVIRVANTQGLPPPWGNSSFSPLRSWPC